MNWFRRWQLHTLFFLILTLPLTGCIFRTAPPAASAQMDWTQRQAQLKTVTAWHVQGAIGVHDAKQAQSASLQWQQSSPDNFNIHLFGPLGVGNTIIVGQPGLVTLTTANRKTIRANSSEALLQQQTGWQVPITDLYYWARGLPAPEGAVQQQLDATSHLQSLQQHGWHIRYDRYISVSGIDLPSKMVLSNGTLTVKLLMNRWQLH